MGKKDKKGSEKSEQKKARKELKQVKASLKRGKKEQADDEEDIETIIQQFEEKERAKTAISTTICAQPSPRANFTMTWLPNGEVLMFGGEFNDGTGIRVFNDLYRWNTQKNEWKKIESLNTPPPRCSHQSVIFRDKMYIFGGEYATLDQFHHYRDMWCLDLKSYVWTEIKPTGDCPSPRSGHRMIIHRNLIVLFGGFYEALREVKFFNDLYLYNFAEERWIAVPYNLNQTQVPRNRSGCQLCIDSSDDVLYLYGGFSKEKMANAKNEMKAHEDMWSISLKQITAAIVNNAVDPSQVRWQKLSKKGDYPTARCGSVMCVYKTKAILFGGVHDNEGDGHSLQSKFFNELFAFDLERKRWLKLGMKQQKEKKGGRSGKGSAALTAGTNTKLPAVKDGIKDESSEEEEEDEEDEEDDEEDEEYEEDEDEDDASAGEGGEKIALNDIEVSLESVTLKETVAHNERKSRSSADEKEGVKDEVKDEEEGEKSAEEKSAEVIAATSWTDYFRDLKEPSPRINPALLLRGYTLIVYGGVMEIGDVEVTLDDCWSLDLNKRDSWKQVLGGTMQHLVWKGAVDDDESTQYSQSERGSDSEGEDSDEDSSDSEEDESSAKNKKEKEKEKEKEKASRANKEKVKGPSSLVQQDGTDSSKAGAGEGSLTPLSGESLREFYSRTAVGWATAVVEQWQQEQRADATMAPLTEKEIKRKAFDLAGVRYAALQPDTLDEQQEEETSKGKGKEKEKGGVSKEKEKKKEKIRKSK